MTDRMQGINKGNLMEITLKPEAHMILGAHKFFVIDKSLPPNTPGRSFTGYVSDRTFDSVTLCYGWNRVDETSRRTLAYLDTEIGVFNFEAIDAYSKLTHKLNS